MLHWFLPYINMNQSEGYTCTLSLEAPSPSHASEVFFSPAPGENALQRIVVSLLSLHGHTCLRFVVLNTPPFTQRSAQVDRQLGCSQPSVIKTRAVTCTLEHTFSHVY